MDLAKARFVLLPSIIKVAVCPYSELMKEPFRGALKLSRAARTEVIFQPPTTDCMTEEPMTERAGDGVPRPVKKKRAELSKELKERFPKSSPATLRTQTYWGIHYLRIIGEAKALSVDGPKLRSFEKNQGAIIQVFHTGKSPGDLKMKETIIGGHKLRLISTHASFYSKPGKLHLPDWAKPFGGILMVFLGVILFIWLPQLLPLSAVSTAQPVTSPNPSQTWPLALVVGGIYVVMGAIIIRNYFTERLPKGLEEFKRLE